MSYYINPQTKTKEEWLAINGVSCAQEEVEVLSTLSDVVTYLVPVCLVDNGPFTAAAIAYDNAELKIFLQDDGRPKQWFLVPREKVKPWCRLLK